MKRTLVCFAVLLSAISAAAQTGRISGKAIDPSGALVTGADITLIGPGNTTVTATKTGRILFGNALIFNNNGFTLKVGTQGDYYRGGCGGRGGNNAGQPPRSS